MAFNSIHCFKIQTFSLAKHPLLMRISKFPIFVTFIFSVSFPAFVYSVHYTDERYDECTPFDCGNVTISYPFWGKDQPEYCGHPGFKIDCDDQQKENTTVLIEIMSLKYKVMELDLTSKVLKLARTDFLGSICPNRHVNTTLNDSLFSYTSNDEIATLLYNCEPSQSHSENAFHCPSREAYFTMMDIRGNGREEGMCNVTVVVPVLVNAVKRFTAHALSVCQVINEGFELIWIVDQEKCVKCVKSGGRCGYNSTTEEFSCFCPDQAYSKACPNPLEPETPANGPKGAIVKVDQSRWKLKVGIGVGAAFGSVAIMCTIFYFYLRHIRKQNSPSSYLLARSISFYHSSVRDHDKGDKFLGVHTFSYSELKEATNNFDETKELGDGGFGTVYKGKLRDGRVVAVKRLYKNNYKRAEQFLNEVKILAHLGHHHLVSLYGCTSHHCRELLLVYEFVPNGTVADHLHGERAKNTKLPWPIRLKIAIETASALTYLHATDVIHRDVKTNNILLDNNFNVKVADFGLSRLFPTDVTHVSTTPQGTPGYVDPEYHQSYQLTNKSDVFSFGVVLIELISSMPAVDITRDRHEINLSNMAINKIQNRALNKLVDPSLGFETDHLVRKMIMAVGELAFQCLQSYKEMRPSMAEVLESLKSIQSDVYSAKKEEEIDIPSDDVFLLKIADVQLTSSPDSVTTNLVSESTIPNMSA